MIEITKPFIAVHLKELMNPKKTTFMHLSSQEGELSWEHTTEEQKEKSFNVSAVNALCESSFGVVTNNFT